LIREQDGAKGNFGGAQEHMFTGRQNEVVDGELVVQLQAIHKESNYRYRACSG
jgi:hypothetical protein